MTKKIGYLVLLYSLLSISKVFSQTLELRPSFGWGHGWGTNYKVNTNDNNTSYHPTFDKPFSPSLELPQIGFMLDFNYQNKFVISIGRIHGKTELKSNIDGNSYEAALIQKWGGEISYSPINYKSKFRLFVLAGIYYANNTNFNYNAGNIEFDTIDSLGNTVSRSYDTSINIRSHGTIVNVGTRFAFYNVRKHRERFSITLNYDFGLNNLWTFKNIVEYDYTTKYIHAYSTSRGNQFKIYFSKPFKLYDLKKDRLNLF